ncbi:hypothetical protein OR573_06990 [Halomonas sp. CH40]
MKYAWCVVLLRTGLITDPPQLTTALAVFSLRIMMNLDPRQLRGQELGLGVFLIAGSVLFTLGKKTN